jgi:hypothetical protein
MFRHPELREGEVLLGNTTREDFDRFDYESKRLGHIAYDTDGRVLEWQVTYPVFVSEAEYADHVRASSETL